MMRCMLLLGLVSSVCAGALLAQGPAGAPGAPPPVRQIPGVVAADPYRNACVDCHLNYVEMKLDARFSTLLQRWSAQVEPRLLAKAQASAPQGKTLKGKHPNTAGAVQDIPAKCLVCHGKNSKLAPPFAGMLHLIHLTGGEQNHFLTLFQGECTYCHKLDLSTGSWRIPSAPER